MNKVRQVSPIFDPSARSLSSYCAPRSRPALRDGIDHPEAGPSPRPLAGTGIAPLSGMGWVFDPPKRPRPGTAGVPIFLFSVGSIEMDRQEVERYRERLIDMGRRVGGDTQELSDEALTPAARLGGAGTAADAVGDSGDRSVEEAQHDVSISLLGNERLLLQQIVAALERIRNGTFGQCQECGGEISKERLDALPYTPHCIQCAQRIQEEAGGIPPAEGIA